MSEMKNNTYPVSTSTINTITVAFSPIQSRNVKKKRLRVELDTCGFSSDSSSNLSPKRRQCKNSNERRAKARKGEKNIMQSNPGKKVVVDLTLAAIPIRTQ